jgi:hypothetical protein
MYFDSTLKFHSKMLIIVKVWHPSYAIDYMNKFYSYFQLESQIHHFSSGPSGVNFHTHLSLLKV